MNSTAITYKWGVMYAAFCLVSVIVVDDVTYNLWSFAGHLVVCAIHYGLLWVRRDLLPYGTAWQPLWVIDWGPFGRRFDLPDHLDGQYLAVRSSEVEETAEDVKAKLRAAQNALYCDPPEGCPRLPVFVAYFRQGEFCNESAEEYRTRIVKAMEAERHPWHVMFNTGKWKDQPETVGIEEGWYLANYLGTNQNGSILE